jgi:hypothetical protein
MSADSRNCLTGFMVSIIGLVSASLLAATSYGGVINGGIVVVTIGVSAVIFRYITSDAYLPMDSPYGDE